MQIARFVLFGSLSVALAVGLHLYLYRRLVRDFVAHRGVRRAVAVAFVALAVAGGSLRFITPRLAGLELRGLSLSLVAWLGIVIYVSMALLALDGVRLLRRKLAKGKPPPPDVPSPERRALLTRAVTVTAAAAGSSVAFFGLYKAFLGLEVREVEVRLAKLPRALDGLSIVQLTDVHVGAVIQERFIKELVQRANSLSPDLFVVTGDLVDGPVGTLGRHVAPLGGLTSRYGTFFVTGNHDYYSGADAWSAFVERLGMQTLRNRSVRIGEKGAFFDLAGVDDWSAHRLGERGYDLTAALSAASPDAATVLLAHQPAGFEEAVKAGVGLQVSGHTHGGQMFPATVIASAIWGQRSVGLSSFEGGQLYVSRGCGFVGPPMRVGAPPELIRIRLVSA